MKMAAHVLVFIVAGLVFFLGLGIGLSQNPAVGTLLWIVAAAIAILNGVWMSRAASPPHLQARPFLYHPLAAAPLRRGGPTWQTRCASRS